MADRQNKSNDVPSLLPWLSPTTEILHICPDVSNHSHKVHIASSLSKQREKPPRGDRCLHGTYASRQQRPQPDQKSTQLMSCSWGERHVAKAGDPALQAVSTQHLHPGHCFSQVGSKGFALFPIKIPPALGKTDAEKLNPSSIRECAPSCQYRIGYSFQMLTARSKHVCCSPPSDGLASPASAPHHHQEPPSLLHGRLTPSPACGGWQSGSLGLVWSLARAWDIVLGGKSQAQKLSSAY